MCGSHGRHLGKKIHKFAISPQARSRILAKAVTVNIRLLLAKAGAVKNRIGLSILRGLTIFLVRAVRLYRLNPPLSEQIFGIEERFANDLGQNRTDERYGMAFSCARTFDRQLSRRYGTHRNENQAIPPTTSHLVSVSGRNEPMKKRFLVTACPTLFLRGGRWR